MKKKQKIVISLSCIILGVLLVGAIRNNTNLMTKKIELNYWNDPYARYTICRANVLGEINVSYQYCSVDFKSKSSKEDIISTNKENYIGEITYIDECLEHSGSLFYFDNNYYVLYYDSDNKFYRIQNCYLNYGMNHHGVYVPSPVYLSLSDAVIQVYLDKGKNMLDYLFDNYSFEQAKEFYERISKEYIEIDEKQKQIIVDGYDAINNEIIDKCIVIDFNKRLIIGKDEQGKDIIITGKEIVKK